MIYGGKTLQGEVSMSGAKNIALKVLTAALLVEGNVVLENIPRIRDVYELINLINALGATAAFTGNNTVTIDSSGLKEKTLDLLFASKIRTSFMLFAPLLSRFGEAYIPNPGGCRLGARPIDRIIDGMKALGVQVDYDSETGFFHAVLNKPPQGVFTFPKVSHTGTELLIMIGAFSEAETVIENAALEPEIDDLIAFLNQAGATIRRENTSIRIKGSKKLSLDKPFRISSDRNEATTYAVMALATKGVITVRDVKTAELQTFNSYIEQIGGSVKIIDESSITYSYQGPLSAIEVETQPHPGFMTDWQPPFAVLLTQANGTSIIHERMFENRFSYVSELQKLGAAIEFIQPRVDNPTLFYEFNYDPEKEYQQAIQITGPQELHNGVMTIADLRAGATLAIGALIASGESIINGASHLERGYEDFVGKVRALGGDIVKV